MAPVCCVCGQLFFPTVLLYMVVSFIQGGAGTGGSGMLNNLRSYLWIPIAQNAYRCLHACTLWRPPPAAPPWLYCPPVHRDMMAAG